MEWVANAQLLPFAAVTLTVVAVRLRMRSLKNRQRAFDEAARVPSAAAAHDGE